MRRVSVASGGVNRLDIQPGPLGNRCHVSCLNRLFGNQIAARPHENGPGFQKISQIFPLTHLLTAARKVMNDGAALVDVTPELTVLTLMTLVSLTIGAFMFSWNR